LNQKVQTEALGKLERNIGTTKGKWWSFEGITYVDCTLITSEVVVFIEGKRTELGPSKNILWYPHRNQILRNLECAFEFIKNTNKKFFVLLITKKIDEYDKNDAKRKEQIEKTIDPETIKNSFPHLTENQIDRLLEHYLGATNWQDIVSIFKLPKSLLD